MVSTLHLLANESIDLCICPDVGSWLDFPAAIRVEGRLGEDLAGQSHTGPHLDPIVLMAHVVELDPGIIPWVGGGKPHEAPALGAHWPHMSLKAVLGCKSFAIISYGERQEVILDIRVADAGP
jgi:hypothetical protein